MDALPFSCFTLKLTGILTFGPSSYSLCYKYFTRCLILFLVAVALVKVMYDILFRDTVISAAMIGVGLYSIELATYLSILKKSKNLDPMMGQVMGILTKDEARKVKSFDRRSFILKLVAMTSFIVLILVHLKAADFKSTKETTKRVSLIEDLIQKIQSLSFTVGLLVFYMLMQAYISLLNVSVVFANHIRSRFSKNEIQAGVHFEHVIRSLKRYNSFMTAINSNIGILPFAVFAVLFVFFAGGISFMVVDGNKYSSQFTAFALAIVIVMPLVFAVEAIRKASKSRGVMKDCWQMAEDCIASSEMTGNGLDEKKETLKFYLSTRGVVRAKGCNSVVIDRSLILSFFSELIPFTVMLFTTLKEFERKVEDKTTGERNTTGR